MQRSSRRAFLQRSAGAVVAAAMTSEGGNSHNLALGATPGLSFRLTGDERAGYAVEFLHGGKTITRADGEFDLLLESGDRVDRAEVLAWRSIEARQESGRVALKGRMRLRQLTTDLNASITYEQVTSQVVKKTVRLLQNDIPRLYIRFRNFIEPIEAPRCYWSFDHADHPGGPAYGALADDVFPAAGFVGRDGLIVGLLTDSGWNNRWSRCALRRTTLGNVPTVRLTDPALLATATAKDRAEGRHHVSLTLGEAHTSAKVPIRETASGAYSFLGRNSHRYTIAFEYRSRAAAKISLWRGNQGSVWTEAVPGTERWLSRVVRIPALPEDGGYSIRLVADGGSQRGAEVRNASLFESSPEPSPWHELLQDREMVRTMFVFADETPATARNLRLTSQIHLADGLGFKGTDAERVLYADFKMLTWVTEPGVDEPMLAPSIHYFEMYFRDVFWTLNASHDRFLNANMLRRIGATINQEGNPDNIITSYHGSIEHSNNELAYLYLIWSYLNRKRFGIAPNMDKVRKVAAFVRSRFDPDGNGVVLVNNPQGCVDVMWQRRPSRFAVSQGYYAVTMRVAKELGVDVPENYLRAAEAAYRGYYSDYGPSGKFLHSFPDNTFGAGGARVDFVDIADLEPEFLSLYLFGRKILTREIVADTLAKFPVIRGCRPAVCKVDGTFFSKEMNPFSGGGYWRPGTYWNGGSWLRLEYQALAAAKMHSLPDVDKMMAQRLEAELSNDPDNPVSREYLSCNEDPRDSSKHRVFAWNLFVLAIHEWLGMRKPQWDPDGASNTQ